MALPSPSTPISVNAVPETSSSHKTLSIATEDDSSVSPDKVDHDSPSSSTGNDRKGSHSASHSDSMSSLSSQAPTIKFELVPEYITVRLSSLICSGEHDKTRVVLKLQNISKHTKTSKNLNDHTSESFDFSTTIHSMTFDTIKIDVYDVKLFNHQHKIGRAYLSLHDLQKRVGNAYDNDGDDNTEPEQSVRSARFDAEAFCKKHDDTFDIELSLYKHGSYSKFRHHRRLPDNNTDQDILITKSSENGDVSEMYHNPARSDSFAQLALNGIEVGRIVVQATLHFPDQTQNPLFTHLRKGDGAAVEVNGQEKAQRPVFQNGRSDSNYSTDSTNSNLSSTFEDQAISPTLSRETVVPREMSDRTPISIPRSAQSGDQRSQGRIMRAPSSPPNLSINYGSPLSPPLSPTLSQDSPTSTKSDFKWLSDGTVPQSSALAWEKSHVNHDDKTKHDEQDDDSDVEKAMEDLDKDRIKGEDVTEEDRKNEEELMASIMGAGSKERKDMYLNKSDETGDAKKTKGKKHKFSLIPEQTRAAFKDIKLIYSSFFGHGWNLSKSEFWRGVRIVEEFYAQNPTHTTNKAFDDIDILEKARHFVRLAIASYGSLPWVYFGYSFKVAPLNFVRFHSDRKNVMDYFKLKKEDMVMWHFDKRTALVPSYYIIREPRYNALCIIIRGTFSITDAMTDLVCEYYPYKDGLVHKGIMDNARFIFEHSGKDIKAALKKFNLDTIYCIGHSLGAGSASLLCSLLQDHFEGQKIDIKAYLFAPPPVCTVNLAVKWERSQIAFINENDIVCRLSYGNALDLKELIKIAAIESENPAYKDLSNEDKLSRILKVLGKAQETLRAVDDIPRLVTGGTITYLHKVYDDTPVIQNKKHDRGSKFGMPEDWSEGGKKNGRSNSIDPYSSVYPPAHHPIHRSLTAISEVFQSKSHSKKSQRQGSSSMGFDDKSSTSSGNKAPTVTPYRPNQPHVRLESSISLALSDTNEKGQEHSHSHKRAEEGSQESQPPKASIGEAIHYSGPSNARDLATQRILNDTERDQESSKSTNAEPSTFEDGYDSDDSDEHRVYTTKKPKYHGSKKKEIRIEFSNRENFMAIPLRKNWLWHHFPQQYDSRIERALDWAKAHKEKVEKKKQRQANE